MSKGTSWILLFALVAGCSPTSSGDAVSAGGDAGGGPPGGRDGGGEPDAAPGGGADDDKAVLVKPGETDEAELVLELPVGQNESGAPRRVVMRLSPDDLPDLRPDDRLSAPAEVQVTTRCDIGQSAPGCGYNPNVAATIILTGDPADTDAAGAGSVALAEKIDVTCTAAEHHCLLVFPIAAATRRLEAGALLPCVAADECSINLVMWAWHPDARAGGADELLVGENEGDFLLNGIVKGDKGRLMVVRERGLGDGDRSERETVGSGSLSIPTTTAPVVIYSHPLRSGGEGLRRDEQYVVEAKVVTAVSSRARLSTRLFLTHDPSDRDGKLEKVVPESIGEGNGINCTDGTSPCTIRKVSVFRVDEDIAGPVYVNLVGVSAVPGGGSASVTVKRGEGFVRSTRYAPSLKD